MGGMSQDMKQMSHNVLMQQFLLQNSSYLTWQIYWKTYMYFFLYLVYF